MPEKTVFLLKPGLVADNDKCWIWIRLLTHCGWDKMATTLADDIFKCIFLNENVGISIRISLKFVPDVPIYNKPALVQIMAWHLPGDKPLYELMMVRLLMHICVTRPQWVNLTKHTPQLALADELWCVFCNFFVGEKSSCYKEVWEYVVCHLWSHLITCICMLYEVMYRTSHIVCCVHITWSSLVLWYKD